MHKINLEKLIKECGQQFKSLHRARPNQYGWIWEAESTPMEGLEPNQRYFCNGKTPIEAVQRLVKTLSNHSQILNSLQ